MNIVQVISSLDKIYGGPSRSVPQLCESLAKNDCDVTLLSIKSNTLNIPAIATKVKTKLFDYLFPRKLSYSPQLIKELERFQCDIFHGHGLWQLPVHTMASLSRKRKIPYLITPRGMLEPWALQQSKFIKRVFLELFQYKDLAHATCIHATAKMEAENIRKLGFKNPVAVIPNGIDISEFPLPKQKPAKDNKTLLFLSRIHPKKGIELLIDAWKEQDAGVRKQWQVEIAGNGDDAYNASLQAKINNSGLQDEIRIIGPQFGADKLAAYHRADLFVLPTYSENFGIVVAEALACGVPVITTMGTPWEELNTCKAGWWIEIGTKSLAETLAEALKLSESERASMGKNGRKLVQEKYSIEAVAAQMIELYNWILKRGNKPEFVNLK